MTEGRYYWLKLKRDFFKRHDIVVIESMPNGKDYILFYLKLLCESVDHDGNLRFSDKIPYNEDMLATITRTNVDIVRSAINLFSELGMMEILDDGTFYMSEVERLIGSESSSVNAIRQKHYRENRKSKLLVTPDAAGCVTKNNASVTKDNASVTNSYADRYADHNANVTKNNESKSKSKSIDLEKEKEKKASPSGQLGAIFEQYEFPERLKESLLAYADHMDECGKPLSTRSMDLTIKKLQRIATSEDEMIEILENSVRKGWKDIYPLDRPKNQSPAVRSFGDYEQRKTNYSELERMMYAADDKGEGFDEE